MVPTLMRSDKPVPPSAAGKLRGPLLDLMRRTVDVQAHEVALLGWSWLFILAVMSSYYVIRPIRDTMGVEGGVEHLQWLFTGTLLVMLALNPAYAALVRALPRERFIAIAYRFFIANLLVFAALLHLVTGDALVWVGRAFFIWVSVFNLFVVSVFWALMVDIFDAVQAKRLFGFLAAGATIGAICGSGLSATLAADVGHVWLLLISAGLLQVAILSARRISGLACVRHDESARADRSSGNTGSTGGTGGTGGTGESAPGPDALIGGGLWTGISHVIRSPYLINIGLYILLNSVTSTFLYFQQAEIVRDYFPDRASRTTFFAGVDLVVNVLTLAVQVFVTSRFLKTFGVGVTAAVLPLATLIGFAALALAPLPAVLVTVQVLRRVGNFGLARPTREVLFTVVPREDKYKAKSVVDTVVYRAGDQAGSWSYALLGMLGAGPAGVAVVALPVSAAWVANALWLGRRQRTLASGLAAQEESGPPPR